jgi:hypothetical protein
LDHLEKVGNSIGNAVKSDLKVCHMPVVRVLPRPTKKDLFFDIP